MPKRMKYRRSHKLPMGGLSVRGSTVDFGEYAIKSLERGFVTSRQIEAARKAVTHFTKRSGRLWIRVFPDKSVTKKPAETRMGGGKGLVDHFSCLIRPGKVIFEMSGVSEEVARQAMGRAMIKLPLKCAFVRAD
jgi:large subunit ribosomal protein L16